jgi:RNA polymerase sigma-70 factor (ECF subfamily)
VVNLAAALPVQFVDERRLAELLRREFTFVWRLLRRLGVEPGAVDDEAQRVFLTAAQKLMDVEPAQERAFLAGVSLRVAANARRAQATRRDTSDLEALGRQRDPNPGPEELLEQKRLRVLLDQALDELPLEQRAVFVLAECEGLTRSEISEALGVTPGTVASRLRLAREQFARYVNRLKKSGAMHER